MYKAPLAKRLLEKIQQTGGKKGSKRHLLVGEHGVPLLVAVTGANVDDVNGLQELLEARSMPSGDNI